ncbi:restless-like transposase [Apiospora marii]|uniref:Restless-like transposase n=1 Tax=Apiospora marii TaxID=335849 RepID=A0ABR1RJV3_9PEZI
MQQGPASAAFNEWRDWFDKPTEPGITDHIRYWHDRRLQYNIPSQMALDILTVQAMSAECECLFSAAGGLIDNTRSSLEITLVSMCMALRSWIRAGILATNHVDDMVLSTAESVENSAIGQMTEDIQAGLINKRYPRL